MRPDMSEVLVERPRKGMRGPRQLGRPPRALDEAPLGEGLRRGRTKYLNENLGALQKYLTRQVGRPWNKVFSEMRAHIKPGNTVQEHVLTHIESFLVRDVMKVTPSFTAPCGLRLKHIPQQRSWWGGGLHEGSLYVDPDDGLIKRARRRLKGPPTRPASVDAPPRWLPGGRILFVQDGQWRFGYPSGDEPAGPLQKPLISYPVSARDRRFYGLKNAR